MGARQTLFFFSTDFLRQWGIVLLSLLTIILHFLISWELIPTFSPYFTAEKPLLMGIILGGIPIIIQILSKIIEGNFGTDLLAILALTCAFLLHEYLAAVLIILMVSGGQALENYGLKKASSVLRELAQRMPFTAHRKRGKKIEDIQASDIAIGDHIILYPHEIVPVDGLVIEGHGSIDEAYLTGEPYHVSKSPGSSVLSGCINGETVLVIQAKKRPMDSRYATIMKVMQEAEQKRPKLRRLADQLGALFGPIALIFALGTWYVTGDALRFLAVLVVATPCPLLIAIPITLISAISMAARRGIIIKDPTVLEQLPLCRTAIFDKTGTLTYGRPELTSIITAKGVNKDDLLQRVASLERYSKHPLASAIVKAAQESKIDFKDATKVSEPPGQGLTGHIDGHQITITHRQKILKTDPEMALNLPPLSPGLECIILQDGKYAATFQFRDEPRPEGKLFIHHLTPIHQFKKIMLVSGDRESEVRYLARRIGIKETLAAQTPEQKLEIIRQETRKAPTLFIGDGINDAPGLASATVGIAFGHQNIITVEAAGAVILDNTLIKLDELLHVSTQMRRIMLQSAVGGITLSVVAMVFAAYGYITPVSGALLQEVIDVFAILNALRLTWREKVASDFGN